MKWIHPTASHSLLLAALAISLGAVGCRNQSGGMANPFLAPDRVPPPATRAILPGQAQPYYPGDPLPVMQSNVAPASITPSTDANGLTWAAPGQSAPVVADSSVAPEPTLATEAMVAIPVDGDPLRFPLAMPAEPPQAAPIAPPPVVATADARNQAVVQASYTEPAVTNIEPVAANPWRQPQIIQPTLPPPPAVQPIIAQAMNPMSVAAMPVATMPAPMEVQLRAVASPSPRIRMPGELAP